MYHTNCPMCKGVEMKLKSKGLEYESIEGEENIKKLGFMISPVIEDEGQFYIGGKACLDYIRSK